MVFNYYLPFFWAILTRCCLHYMCVQMIKEGFIYLQYLYLLYR